MRSCIRPPQHPCLHVFVNQVSLTSLSTCAHASGLPSLGLEVFYEGFPSLLCACHSLKKDRSHGKNKAPWSKRWFSQKELPSLHLSCADPLQKEEAGEEKGGLTFSKGVEGGNYVSKPRIVCLPRLLFPLHCSSVHSSWNKEKKGSSQNRSHAGRTGKRRHITTCVFICAAHSVLGFLSTAPHLTFVRGNWRSEKLNNVFRVI